VTLANPFPQERAVIGGTTTASGYEVDTTTGYLQSYNLTVEYAVRGGTVVETG